MCPNTCFSRTTYSLNRYNVKGEIDCFNCKARGFLRLFTLMFTKESNGQSTFLRQNQLVYSEYLTIIKKSKLNDPRVHTAALTES